MNSKGVSAVIATILMLMITIALAGTAYLFISGTFTARSGVVLSVDPSSRCNTTSAPGSLIVYVKNDGTTVSPTVNIDVTYPNGTISTTACSIGLINAGATNSTSCIRLFASQGSHAVRVYTGSSSATGTIYCAG